MASKGLVGAASYKARKEAFVSDLTGGSITEINLVALVAPAALLLWTTLQTRRSFFTPYTVVSFVVDFLLNVVGTLFALTLYSSAPVLLNLLLLIPALVLALPLLHHEKPQRSKRRSVSEQTKQTAQEQERSLEGTPSKAFLTHYRGGMMVVTCLAILAVDFRVFPRRFAKTENWGTSLMDLGVGSFVFSAGVVSARSVLHSSPAFSKTAQKSLLQRLATATKHSIPLLVLGFVRLYSVKGLDYAEHVTEYGVHWNFFFTLALLPPFVDISDLITTSFGASYAVVALLFAATYEMVLNTTSLKSYILISPRGPSLLSKNREGIFSFIGYLAIFLFGRNSGITVLSESLVTPKGGTNALMASRINRNRRFQLLRSMFLQSVLASALYFASTSVYAINLTVPRRLANMPYVLWVTAFNTAQITLLALIETLLHQQVPATRAEIERATSKVMAAFNKNGLIVFLAANLLTGFVNLTLNTLDMSDIGAVSVLTAYAVAVTGLAMALDRLGWKIKL